MVKRLPVIQETWVRSLGQKIPWRRKWQPTPAFLPGKSRGQSSLIGYSKWGRKELDATRRLHFFTIWPAILLIGIYIMNNESTYLHENFHKNNILTLLHNNVLHNSHKEETKWVFINWWVFKHNVVYPYNTVLFGSKKEWSTDACYNMMDLVTLHWVKENTCVVLFI